MSANVSFVASGRVTTVETECSGSWIMINRKAR
ncbi:hypothetical protein DHODJN_14200 [Methylorubrum extorquens]